MTPPTQLVCHYTTVDALLKMTSEDALTLEASHIASFEDIAEGQGIDNDVLDNLVEFATRFDKENELCPPIYGVVKDHIDTLKSKLLQKENYVLSFSEAVDFLPMWRLYASGGSGVCLVFNSAHLSNLIEREGGIYRKVDYGPSVFASRPSSGFFWDQSTSGHYLKSNSQYDENAATRDKIIAEFKSNSTYVRCARGMDQR
jgi:hypothetical protein